MTNDDIAAHEKFLFTLEWLLAVVRRYSAQLRFALIHIDYNNPRMLGEAYGAKNASQKLDEVMHALRQAFRKTDLVARDKTDIWILFPYAPDEEKLVDKIKYIIDTASQSGLEIVERDLSIFSLPHQSMESCKACTAPEFLNYLKANHISLSRKEIALPANEARPAA
jgi:GGDEF domain-containing protein